MGLYGIIVLSWYQNNQFSMDVWWSVRYLCKYLESSNWNIIYVIYKFINGCFRFQDKISIHFTLLSNDLSSIPVQRWQARRKRKRDADDTFPPSPSTPDGAGGADDLTNSLPRKRPRCCCRGRERCAQKVGQIFSVFFSSEKWLKQKTCHFFWKGGEYGCYKASSQHSQGETRALLGLLWVWQCSRMIFLDEWDESYFARMQLGQLLIIKFQFFVLIASNKQIRQLNPIFGPRGRPQNVFWEDLP